MRQHADRPGGARQRGVGPSAPLLALVAAAVYAGIGLVALDPRTLFTVDAAVKIFQTRALLASGFHSLAIPYPAAAIDPGAQFLPFIPPFVFNLHGNLQAVFPSAVAIFNAPWFLLFGIGGMVLAASLSGGAAVGTMSMLESTVPRWIPALVLGAGTCFWFYAVLPWEHVPAAALSTAAWVVLSRRATLRAVAVGGLALGAAAVLREESVLLLPGMLWIISRRPPFIRHWMVFLLAASSPVIVFAMVDFLVFGRPPAVHMAHAVGLVASELKTAPEVHRLPVWSVARRYEVVVHDWLLGREGLLYSSLFAVILFLLAGFRDAKLAGLGVLTVCILTLVQLGQDFSVYLVRPGFPVGLLRLSPVLLFAVLPLSRGIRSAPNRTGALVTSAFYLAGLLLDLNSTGGPGLGPRHLLPILPMLCLAACEGLWSYRRHASDSAPRWPVWEIGVLLLTGSICMQVAVGMRAYVTFNQVERRAVEALDRTAEDVIVLDDPRTMSVVGPVYDRRLVMLADTPPQATSLTDTLRRASVPSFLLVSRAEQQPLTFQPFQLMAVDHFGKTTIQHWRLPEPASR
jgi:hypothetical protein